MDQVQSWAACKLERKGRVYVLTLTGPSDHRFNPSTIGDIAASLDAVRLSEDAGCLVTTNEGRFFSNGLDLPWIFQNLASGSLRIIQLKFEGLLASVMKLGIPTVAAICGHAAGGGFMLALAHDYRFMKSGKEVLYMSELDHGMFMPRSLMTVIKSKLLPGPLVETMLKARKFRSPEGLKLGLVDRIFDSSEKTIDAAIDEAEKLASRNWKRDIYANVKAAAFPGVIEELEAHRDPYLLPKGAKL
ncbi:enoyl-CoA delta isomerase 2, peroxisomal-like [Nymphaea colorata]|uniref:Delta(3)-Delta(2)-enoyl-CoA isomerase n=1 Tax=Nymphaea colorata TaxID=210225 RepID=A0A5K0W5G0_9MAGN|nr:enoyl-CoA delta isomerase 2, peroxisomal-like [Nymphaea colorata]